MARRDGMLRLELISLHLASAGGCSAGYWGGRLIFAALLSLLHGVLWVDSGFIISPSPSGRLALAPAYDRIRLAFPLAGDQRNYLSCTIRALHQAPAGQYCNL